MSTALFIPDASLRDLPCPGRRRVDVLAAGAVHQAMGDLGWDRLTAADRRRILAGIADGTAHGGPFHVEVHPTDRCNLGCFFCSTSWRREHREMPLERFRRLLGEMRELGTRSICLSGGGDPLAHREARAVVASVAEAQLPLSNLVTNGLGLGPAVTDALLAADCDQVRISLNCGDAASYARMMRTAPATFDRVVTNVARLLHGRRGGARRPRVIVQFLVYRENFRTVPLMYRLARDLGVDSIVFNGLASLEQPLRMTSGETAEMMALFEEVLREDEFRWVLGIWSFEQDVSDAVTGIEAAIGAERDQLSWLERATRLVRRSDLSWRERFEHHWRIRRRRQLVARAIDGFLPCIRPWYALTVRPDGIIPVCCVRQHRALADLDRQTLAEAWTGDGFQLYRREMRRVLTEGKTWQHDPARDRWARPRCAAGSSGLERCPFRSFYYLEDGSFVRNLRTLLGSLAADTGARGVTAVS